MLPFLVTVFALSVPVLAETDAEVRDAAAPDVAPSEPSEGLDQCLVPESSPVPEQCRVPEPSPIPEQSPVPKGQDSRAATEVEEYEAADALDIALVRQGGRVLPAWTIEVEPAVTYFYDDIHDTRRDHVNAALTTRVGLLWATQAEVRVPYVIQDHWSGFGTSSGVGDTTASLTKELWVERERIPGLLVFGQWRAPTGDVKRDPPTGFGQHAIQIGLTGAKRQDPIVLFGTISYVESLGTARLGNGDRTSSGDVFGGRLGLYLVATPDTTLLYGVALNSSSADRFNGHKIDETDRLRGIVELGITSIIGHEKFLGITAGIGFTPAAPNFVLTVSIPWRMEVPRPHGYARGWFRARADAATSGIATPSAR